MELPDISEDSGPAQKFTTNTFLSLHVVLLVVIFAIWLVRLKDFQDRLEERVKKLENSCHQECPYPTTRRPHHDD